MQALVLSSNVAVRATLVGYLHQGGYPAIAVTSAEELRHVFASQPVNVVLLELAERSNICFEVCRELRERFGYQLLIIFISTVNTSSRRVVAIEMGADDFMSTSCSSDELLARIEAGYRRHIPALALNRP